MDFWLVQGFGIIATILTCISFFQKEKYKIMIYLVLTNLCFVFTYLFAGTLAGALLVVGALIRTVVYYLYSKYNKKPQPVVLIAFLVYFCVVMVFAWSGPVDLLMFVNLVMLTYTTWQDNTTVLRVGYVISSLLLIPYNILLCAYTALIGEVIMLVSVVLSIIKYLPSKEQKKLLIYNEKQSTSNVSKNATQNADDLNKKENAKNK